MDYKVGDRVEVTNANCLPKFKALFWATVTHVSPGDTGVRAKPDKWTGPKDWGAIPGKEFWIRKESLRLLKPDEELLRLMGRLNRGLRARDDLFIRFKDRIEYVTEDGKARDFIAGNSVTVRLKPKPAFEPFRMTPLGPGFSNGYVFSMDGADLVVECKRYPAKEVRWCLEHINNPHICEAKSGGITLMATRRGVYVLKENLSFSWADADKLREALAKVLK